MWTADSPSPDFSISSAIEELTRRNANIKRAIEVLRRCGKYVGMMHRAGEKEAAEEFRVQVRAELQGFGDGRAAEALLGLADLCFEEQSSELFC